jgi:hypothetical protein
MDERGVCLACIVHQTAAAVRFVWAEYDRGHIGPLGPDRLRLRFQIQTGPRRGATHLAVSLGSGIPILSQLWGYGVRHDRRQMPNQKLN